jgi:hypothetical protein
VDYYKKRIWLVDRKAEDEGLEYTKLVMEWSVLYPSKKSMRG